MNRVEQDFRLRVCIEEAVQAVTEMAEDKECQVFLIFNANLPAYVFGDPWEVKQIISGFISNALSHTDSDIINMEVTLESSETSYCVRFNTHGSTSELSLDLSLMFGKSEKNFQPLEYRSIDASQVLFIPMEIDDFSESISGMLADTSVEVSKDVNEGLGKLLSRSHKVDKVDLIVLSGDLKEPQTQSFVKSVKVMPLVNKTKILFLSGAPQKGDAIKAKDIGCLGFIGAPFNKEELMNMISAVLGAQEDVLADSIITQYLQKESKHSENLSALVVEDNSIDRVIMSMMLQKMNINCDVAASADEGIEAVNNHAYDIVFLDYYMPKLNGYEMAKAIKTTKVQQQLYSVLLLAKEKEDLLPEDYQGYIDHIAVKPTTHHMLCEILKEEFVDCKTLLKSISPIDIDSNKPADRFILKLEDRLSVLNQAIDQHDYDTIIKEAEEIIESARALKMNLLNSVVGKLQKYAKASDTTNCRYLIKVLSIFIF